MDKAKRKSLIISYLTNSINFQDFHNAIDFDLQAMSDPLLGAISSDLSNKADATLMKDEILAFNEKQKEGLTSLGKDYIEAEKRRLTIQASKYTSLLSDTEIRAIIDEWGTSGEIVAYEAPAQEYKNASFTNLLNFLKNHPEYNSEIQEILTEIESENGLSEELQEFSHTIDSNSEEISRQNDAREELTSFIDETLHTFDTLLQLDAVDSDTIDTIRNVSTQSYQIYKDKYSKLIAGLANDSTVFVTSFYPTNSGLEKRTELDPVLQQKLDQIENIIGQLEEKYNISLSVTDKEQVTTADKSIKDEVGDEFQEEIPEQQDEKQAQAILELLQKSDNEVDKMPDGAKKKQEVVQLIQNLDRDIQKNNQQEQTNSNNEQR